MSVDDVVPAVVADADASIIHLRAGSYRVTIDKKGFAWTRKTAASQLVRPGDLVEARLLTLDPVARTATASIDQPPLVEGAVLAIDNHTGQIKAMVGGYSFERSKFNRATQALRQVGSAFNVLKAANALPGRSNTFHSFEVAATKRFSKKWTGSTSFWTTKNHQWIITSNVNANNPQSPNDDRFPLNDTWTWEGRLNASYQFPHAIQFSALLRTQSGIPGQRTFIFTGLPQSSNLTLRMEPYGARRGPAITVMNVRAGKRFALGASRRFELSFEIFNLLNSSAATTTNYASGSSFAFTTGVVSPRVARIGSTFSF